MSQDSIRFSEEILSLVPSSLSSFFEANSFSSSITALILGFALLSLIVLSLVYNDRVVFASRSELPSPKAYPLIGSTPWLMTVASKKVKILDEFLRFQRTLTKGALPWTASVPIFGGRFTTVNHPAYVNYVQKTNFENYNKGPAQHAAMSSVLGDHGIFVSDGPVWKAQRKLASNIFSVSRFRNHVQETVQGDLTTLHTLMERSSMNGQQIDLQDVFFRYTLSSFATMAFSTSIGCLPSNPAELATSVPFAVAFDFAQLVMDHRLTNPMAKVIELWSQEGRQMRKATKVLDDYCFKMIDDRLKRNAELSAAGEAPEHKVDDLGKDILDLFMEKGADREELRACIINFLIAGRDTTAQTLSWGFYELFLNPEVVPKIREEVDSVLEGRMMDYDDVKSLPYLQAVLFESIRLHPAVPKNIKKAVKDDVIRPYQGFDISKSTMNKDVGDRLPDIRIKAGESVGWSDYVMARTPEIWGPDCCEFKPERFIEENAEGEKSIKNLGSALFHAFNHGPRLCLGQTLATYEGMAAIAAILSKFDVIYDAQALKKDPPTFAESLTHPIQNPYKVSFKRRA